MLKVKRITVDIIDEERFGLTKNDLGKWGVFFGDFNRPIELCATREQANDVSEWAKKYE
ncbi:MAG: hypothetical protein U5M23_01375 [Marinagarivorans sp.]|nr:hypothetical protein [Marinagarivorans sp.]